MQIASISMVGMNVTATKAMKATASTVQVHSDNNYILLKDLDVDQIKRSKYIPML